MGVVSDIERQLGTLRAAEAADGRPEIRTSTMTHLVWCPPEWHRDVRKTLTGLAERHPARTIILLPESGRRAEIVARAELKVFRLPGLAHEVVSEVIEIRLRGDAAHHPGSVVAPLLVSGLPVFCRWRGELGFRSGELDDVLAVADRLVVDSSEWSRVPAAYVPLVPLFERCAVSDIAFARTLPWRRRLAALWPQIGSVERLRVEGPRADAALLAGWMRSRLKREISLTRRQAAVVESVHVDGQRVASPGTPPTPSELLSDELDRSGRDPVYEAAVRATGTAADAACLPG
ncbi:MAG: glucose-6-phosphate dehydrogenase assembly protein OpcA [Thermoleophilia bacterium]